MSLIYVVLDQFEKTVERNAARWVNTCDQSVNIDSSFPRLFLKVLHERIARQVKRRVRGVIEHLSNNLTARSRVFEAFAFDQGWNPILIDNEKVQAPSAFSGSWIFNDHLAFHQKPAARIFRINLIARDKIEIFF